MSIGLGLNLSLRGSGIGGPLEPVFGVGGDRQASIISQPTGPVAVTAGAQSPAYVRIPIIIRADNGDLLAFTDVRSAGGDDTGYGFIVFRSTNNGATWSDYVTVYNHATFVAGTNWVASGSVAVDYAGSGAVTFIFIQSSTTNHTVWRIRSTDNGLTWGAAGEITSTVKVVAVNNPVGHTFNGTAWTWVAPTCTAAIQLTSGPNAGRLLVPFDHRFVFSTAQPSYSHTIKSDDGGDTWSLHGGLAEIAANEFSNECSITETTVAGRLVMHIRNTNGGVYRYQSVSTDYGATWSNMAALVNLIGNDTSGDVKRCGNYLVASYASDPAHLQRMSLSLALSRDDGATWALADVRMIYGRPAAYSSLYIDGDDVYLLFERGQGNTGGSIIPAYSHAIQFVKTNLAWLLTPTPRYSLWNFNEEAAGLAGNTFGGEITDYGNLDERAVCGTAAARPLYTADGIALTASADHINLSPATDPAFDCYVGESLCVEVEATIDVGASGELISKYVGITGYKLEIDGAGFMDLHLGDGTNSAIISPASFPVNDGVRRTYGFYRNATTGKVGMLVNGVRDGGEATYPYAMGQLTSGLLLGANSGGTGQLACTVHRAKATRGVPTQFLTPNEPKQTLASFRGYTAPTLTLPTLSIAAPVLWTHQTYNNGLDAYADLFLTERYPVPPPANSGIRSIRDGSSFRRRMLVSESLRMKWANDAKMGPCFDMSAVGAVSGLLYDTALFGATNGIDFIQNSMLFTVAFTVNFAGTTGILQTVFDNCSQSSSFPGFTFYRDNTTGKLVIYISMGSTTTRVTGSVAASPVLAYGTSYFIAVVGRGLSTAYDLYIAPITADFNAASPTQPTVTKYTGSVPTAGAGPYTSTKYLRIGQYTEGNTRGLNGKLKNCLFYNDDATDADIDALALFSVSG